jgi:aconitate hydratase
MDRDDLEPQERAMLDSFETRYALNTAERPYQIHSLGTLNRRHPLNHLPYAIKLLLENLLRHEDGDAVTESDIQALLDWSGQPPAGLEIAFTPARVLLQDFTGVPAVVDLAAMREAVASLGGDPARVNPLSPVELVIDHSVQVDAYGRKGALDLNTRIEFQRNRERYAFLRWGQQAFDDFRVVPPGTGIVHQVNLEYLARVVCTRAAGDLHWAYPDTLVGTDSHTTMINGLGVLGWGVGGIEAEAGMLGQPLSMLLPEVIGFRLHGRLSEGATATDLVLTVTEQLRHHGVVGKFVEFFGSGLVHLPLSDRATIANMAPEYGATCGLFPIDGETLRYLRLTGRSDTELSLIEQYARHQGLYQTPDAPAPRYTDVLELDLATVRPSLAGPKRPQDRVPLSRAKQAVQIALHEAQAERTGAGDEQQLAFQNEGGDTAVDAEPAGHTGALQVDYEGEHFLLRDGAVVIAAITSCTNTSNPSVMVAAGLLARKARQRGLGRKPWVKTSLAPGSQAVTAYLKSAGLLEDLEACGFYLVGYGCTTCIGNSGPLPEPVAEAITRGELITGAVLSGNRNFEGRIHPQVPLNYLASPPLVVAYALAGTLDIDLYSEPLGHDGEGAPVFFRDLWPTAQEVREVVERHISPETFRTHYADVFEGDARWQGLETTASALYPWQADSTYIRRPPFFEHMSVDPEPIQAIVGARVLARLGDSVTTDHISPAGAISIGTPAAEYLRSLGVEPRDFNSYGSRRGNHEVMVRGTFANVRLRNQLAPETEGGWTRHQPTCELMSIYEAAMCYAREEVSLIILAGREYGSGSSRDWAAKGPLLLGVRAVIAESYERIHRSNLVGMGILPLAFVDGQNAAALGLDGTETYDIQELEPGSDRITVTAAPSQGEAQQFQVEVRIDTPQEWSYYRHGGILRYVVRNLARAS